jgi:uncharacterized protein
MAYRLLPRRLPLALVRLARRFPVAITAAALLVWVAVAVTASRVQVETDILSLVPRDNPVVEEFKRTVERFGSVDTVLVVIRLDPARAVEPSVEYADILARSLREWDLIDWVEYRIEDPLAAAVPLLDRATLFLDRAELDSLLQRLAGQDLSGEAERLRAQLLAPQGLVAKELLRADPFGLLPRILEHVRFGGVGARLDPATGCMVDSRRTMLLMLAKPVRPAPDIRFDRELAAGLEQRVRAAEAAWRAAGWEGPAPRVELTGGNIVALHDSQLITKDIAVNLVGSLVGVMLLFALAFRRPTAMLYALVPLLTGLALAFVFAVVVLGRLNTLTASSGAMLVGLGIDLVIVLYGRYLEERRSGAGHEEAVDTMGRFTGVSVLLGAVTTATTFYAFLVTDFRGLWELGAMTGTGILCVALSVFVLLPLLLGSGRGHDQLGPRLRTYSFGSDRLCRASARHPGATIALAVVATVALGVAIRGLEFDDDIRHMRSAGNQASRLRDEVMVAFGMRFSPMMVRLDGADEAAAVDAARALLPELKGLVDGQTLASVDTIATVVPPGDEQRAVIRRLGSARESLGGFEQRFDVALRRAGLSPEAFRDGVAHLTRALQVTEPIGLSDLAGTPLERMAGRYLVRYDGGVSTAVYCYPPAERWLRSPPPALVDVVRRHPGAVLAGTNVVSFELRHIVWGDAAKATILGLVLVLSLLWGDLGGARGALLACLPMAVGLVWMLGAMAALGIAANFMNIFVMTMMVGIGTDYGIYILNRWRESGGEAELVAETAKAVEMAALTTMVGFGSLVTSHFPGLRSVGAAALFGVSSTALLTVTLLPAVLTLADRRRRRVTSVEVPDRGV